MSATETTSPRSGPRARLLLVDISSYFYRAFHAMPDFRSPTGDPTGAIFGVANMLNKLRDEYPADYSACVFDPKGKTFRDDIYPEYKANREKMPEDLAHQVKHIREVAEALGWPCIEVAGMEADDVIGTLTKHAVARGVETIISTGDKDLAQLVEDGVLWYNTMSNEKLGVAGITEKFGVPPDRIIDYLALMGDNVDNVPGVEKVGPKTAAKWIAEFGSLDGVIANAANIKGVVGENLRKALDWLPTGRTLVTVKCDVPLPFDFDTIDHKQRDIPRLDKLYEHFGFKGMRAALRKGVEQPSLPAQAGEGAASAVFKQADKDAGATRWSSGEMAAKQVAFVNTRRYETISTNARLDAWIAKLNAATLACVDTETTSLDPMAAQIVGLSFACVAGEAAYLPLRHIYPGAPDQLDFDASIAKLRPWLEDASKPKLGQNIKYDLHVFANHGITVRGYGHDTLLQSYVLESHQRHDMDSLATRHLGATTISFEQVAGKGASQIGFEQVSIETATEYSSEDSDVTLQLHGALYPQVAADEKLKFVYAHIEMPTTHVLLTIERNGVLIDSQLLEKQSSELGMKMMELEAKAHDAAGQPFNLGSPKQLAEILFDKQGIKPLKKTPGGAPSTDEETLTKLAEDYPLPKILLEHRGISKLKSTYTDKLPRMVNPKTGRVHTNYGQAVAVTGRLSSNDPNLQNIPVRTAEGRRIREAFIAPPGSKILSADYSQIELRIMAHLSSDPGLLDAFAKGEDVHRATASEVFGVTREEVSSEQRRYAKVINFGLIYGMSAFGLASNLGIERAAAASYIDKYFARYPGVKAYMDRTRNEAHERGYVETVFGRRLWLPDIKSGNQGRRQGAERAAINAPMQGTAADLIKLAMIAVQGWLETENLATRMIMQVHDELVLEVPESELERVKAAVPGLMTNVAKLLVPLVAEPGVGRNWEEAH
ncbi:MAG: DNA polymerase I [Betaproteobacteria bacterium]|nr:DNA polymerase I [Betaproteobacteria bacterium]